MIRNGWSLTAATGGEGEGMDHPGSGRRKEGEMETVRPGAGAGKAHWWDGMGEEGRGEGSHYRPYTRSQYPLPWVPILDNSSLPTRLGRERASDWGGRREMPHLSLSLSLFLEPTPPLSQPQPLKKEKRRIQKNPPCPLFPAQSDFSGERGEWEKNPFSRTEKNVETVQQNSNCTVKLLVRCKEFTKAVFLRTVEKYYT